MECYDEDYHQHFGGAVDADGSLHIGGGERTVVGADVGFVEELAEIIVRTTKTTIENTSKGCFWIAAIGRSVAASVDTDESEE